MNNNNSKCFSQGNLSNAEEYVIFGTEHLILIHYICSPPLWRRGSGLDFGSEDPGAIPGLPSPRVGPLMARRLKTSSDVLVPVSGWARHAKDP